MYNELTKLLKEEIDKKYESTKEVSKKLRDLQRIYNALIPNKNKKNMISIMKLRDKELFYEFIEIIHDYNKILYNELISLNTETKRKDKIYLNNDNFVIGTSILSQADRYCNNVDFEAERKMSDKIRDFFAYAATYVVELYEKLYEEKERKKEERKEYESLYKSLIKNRILTSKEINLVTSLIEKQDDKEKYYKLLNEYINKSKEKIIEKKEESKNTYEKSNYSKIIYKDDEIIEKKEEQNNFKDTLILNYVNTIYTLENSEKDLTDFLNALSYNEDFEEILNKIIIIIRESNKKELLSFILKYKKELVNDNDPLDDSDIVVLYYGFSQEKEKILNDIEKTIPKEDYKSVLKALEQIKKDGAIDNRKNIVRIRKVFKLRVNNIRITFKRISKNTYIILGIYRKKDNHGSDIIHSTERRNNHLLRDENQIINAMKIEYLWNLYLEKNSDIEDNIFSLLKRNIKIN